MATITCNNCGAEFENSFKFCPECAAPNAMQPQRTRRSGFTVVGETPEQKKTITPVKKQASFSPVKKTIPSIPKVTQTYDKEYDEEEYEDNIEEEIIEQDNEFDESFDEDFDEDFEEDEYEDEEYADDDIEEEEIKPSPRRIQPKQIVPQSKAIPKQKPLSAPASRPVGIVRNTEAVKPVTKKPTQVPVQDYEPNHDGYYDDRLPAVLDEITKTSHADLILKIVLAVICVVALIIYCIFYLKV